MQDDDLDWDEWMAMSEEQHDAILKNTMREYYEWLNRLTPLQRYRYFRRKALEGCLTWRRIIALVGSAGWSIEYLKNRQKSLLKLRAELSTGIYPGTA